MAGMDKVKVWLESKARRPGEKLLIGVRNYGKSKAYKVSIYVSKFNTGESLLNIELPELEPNQREFLEFDNPFLYIDDNDFGYILVPLNIDLTYYYTTNGNFNKNTENRMFMLRILKEDYEPTFPDTAPDFNRHRYYQKLMKILKEHRFSWIYAPPSLGKTTFVRNLEGNWVYINSKELLNPELPSLIEISGIIVDDIHRVIDMLRDEEKGPIITKNLLRVAEAWRENETNLILVTSRDIENVSKKLKEFGLNFFPEKPPILILKPLDRYEFERVMLTNPLFFDESLLSTSPEFTIDIFKSTKKYIYLKGERKLFDELMLLYHYKYPEYDFYVFENGEVKNFNSLYPVEKRSFDKQKKLLIVDYNIFKKLKKTQRNRYSKIIVFVDESLEVKEETHKIKSHIKGELYDIIGGNPFFVDIFWKTLIIKQMYPYVSRKDMREYLYHMNTIYLNDIRNFLLSLSIASLVTLVLLLRRFSDRLNMNYPMDFLDMTAEGFEMENIFKVNLTDDDLYAELINPSEITLVLFDKVNTSIRDDIRSIFDHLSEWLNDNRILENYNQLKTLLEDVLPEGYIKRKESNIFKKLTKSTSRGITNKTLFKSFSKLLQTYGQIKLKLIEIKKDVRNLEDNLEFGVENISMENEIRYLENLGIVQHRDDYVFTFYVFYYIMIENLRR